MKKFACIFLTGILLGAYAYAQTSNKGSMAELIIEPGEHWQGTMKVFVFSVKKTPQMAAWLEDENGQYIATITVTGRSAHNSWRSAPKEGRPEALPVWNHKYNNPSPDDIDTVSTATPQGSVITAIDNKLLVDGNTYHVYFEVNHSFDYNDYWTKDNSDVNGQPSLVYHAQFIAGEPYRLPLVPIGHGSVDGSDGNIVRELGTITSALDIVKSVTIVGK